MRRVIVHIDRLVLDGFRHEDRQRIAEGLRGELGRLLANPAAAERLASVGHLSRIQVGKVNLAQGAQPQRAGASAARAIARGLSR